MQIHTGRTTFNRTNDDERVNQVELVVHIVLDISSGVKTHTGRELHGDMVLGSHGVNRIIHFRDVIELLVRHGNGLDLGVGEVDFGSTKVLSGDVHRGTGQGQFVNLGDLFLDVLDVRSRGDVDQNGAGGRLASWLIASFTLMSSLPIWSLPA